MNKPIRTISVFCLVLFVALMANATYLQFWQADKLDNDPRNRRVIEAAYSVERGAILVARDAVAESRPIDDRYEYLRTYPMPMMYSHVTGYFSFFSQTGVERSMNPILSGEDDRLFVRQLVDLLANQSDAGGNVSLTIDPAAQQAAYDGLSSLGAGVEGSVVALEPATGKILAAVSLPTYDPNKLASHDLTSVSRAYDELESRDDQPLLNRSIQQTLPPGSTFKLVTAAAAIESGRYTADDQVPGGASYQLPETVGDTGLIDNEGRACGSTTIPFEQAMEQSCNTTFAALAVEVGHEAMLEQAEAFGFNQRYLENWGPQAVSVFPEEANAPQTGQTGIGQYEVRATPLQMAMVSAGIANDGVVKRPYIVDEIQSAEYDVLEQTEDDDFSRAVSSETAEDLTQLMVATVEDGTASPAAIPGRLVAGKTGTAQSGQDDVAPYAWFVSFAPAENAEVAVAVMIESADIPR
nr:penicillin-binding protein 2 [Actinomycetota bacterium]